MAFRSTGAAGWSVVESVHRHGRVAGSYWGQPDSAGYAWLLALRGTPRPSSTSWPPPAWRRATSLFTVLSISLVTLLVTLSAALAAHLRGEMATWKGTAQKAVNSHKPGPLARYRKKIRMITSRIVFAMLTKNKSMITVAATGPRKRYSGIRLNPTASTMASVATSVRLSPHWPSRRLAKAR